MAHKSAKEYEEEITEIIAGKNRKTIKLEKQLIEDIGYSLETNNPLNKKYKHNLQLYLVQLYKLRKYRYENLKGRKYGKARNA